MKALEVTSSLFSSAQDTQCLAENGFNYPENESHYSGMFAYETVYQHLRQLKPHFSLSEQLYFCTEKEKKIKNSFISLYQGQFALRLCRFIRHSSYKACVFP